MHPFQLTPLQLTQLNCRSKLQKTLAAFIEVFSSQLSLPYFMAETPVGLNRKLFVIQAGSTLKTRYQLILDKYLILKFCGI
jgi:hypothetical protein